MNLIYKLLLNVFALLLAAYVFPGIEVDGFFTALVVAILLGLLNLIVRPILFVLTLPITILTLGLFVFVLNASIFWFVSSFVDGFKVAGFWAAFFGTMFVSLVSWVGNKYIED